MSDTIKTKRITKSKVDKYKGFKVPKKIIKSTRWTIFIYNMIKEAKPELLLNELVKNAYNNLVDCLIKYEDILETWIPTKYYTYNILKNGIILKKDCYSQITSIPGISDNCIPGFWNYPLHADKKQIEIQINANSDDIINTYHILYELIKRDIIPYMELKEHEINSKKNIEIYYNNIKKHDNYIKIYEKCIDDTRFSINGWLEKISKLQEPIVLTSFD